MSYRSKFRGKSVLEKNVDKIARYAKKNHLWVITNEEAVLELLQSKIGKSVFTTTVFRSVVLVYNDVWFIYDAYNELGMTATDPQPYEVCLGLLSRNFEKYVAMKGEK